MKTPLALTALCFLALSMTSQNSFGLSVELANSGKARSSKAAQASSHWTNTTAGEVCYDQYDQPVSPENSISVCGTRLNYTAAVQQAVTKKVAKQNTKVDSLARKNGFMLVDDEDGLRQSNWNCDNAKPLYGTGSQWILGDPDYESECEARAEKCDYDDAILSKVIINHDGDRHIECVADGDDHPYDTRHWHKDGGDDDGGNNNDGSVPANRLDN